LNKNVNLKRKRKEKEKNASGGGNGKKNKIPELQALHLRKGEKKGWRKGVGRERNLCKGKPKSLQKKGPRTETWGSPLLLTQKKKKDEASKEILERKKGGISS